MNGLWLRLIARREAGISFFFFFLFLESHCDCFIGQRKPLWIITTLFGDRDPQHTTPSSFLDRQGLVGKGSRKDEKIGCYCFDVLFYEV